MKPSRLISLVAVAVLLASCKGDAPQEGEVTGEVLEGTISDEMLKLDQVRSQAPLADPTGAGSGPASDATAEEPEGETEAEDASPAEPPAEPDDAGE